MVKRIRTEGQGMIYNTLHRKLKIEQHELHKTLGLNWVLRKVNISCSTSDTRRATVLLQSRSSTRTERDCDNDKRYISVVIWHKDIL